MKILFLEPPLAQRVGGLEAAVNGLRDALKFAGVQVESDLPNGDLPPGFDAVHFHGLWQPRFARIAAQCRVTETPFVVSPHGMLEPWAWKHKAWKKWPYYYLIERRFLNSASCVLATAKTEAQRLAKFLPHRRIETLPLGMTGAARPDYDNARAHLGWNSDERVFLFLSRIHVKKGLDLLLNALTRVNRRDRVRLVIVGGGEAKYVDALKSFTREYAAKLPRVDWVGEIWGEQRWSYFQGADLFCLPTHSENFGLAVLEALQVGTPVLTTRDTPWVDYLTESRGYIADPKVESLLPLLLDFLAGPNRLADYREETAAWAHATFSWDTLAPQYRSLYESLATNRPNVT